MTTPQKNIQDAYAESVLKEEHVTEAKNRDGKSAKYQGHDFKKPRSTSNDRWATRDYMKAYIHDLADEIGNLWISEHESSDPRKDAEVLDAMVKEMDKFDGAMIKLIAKFNA